MAKERITLTNGASAEDIADAIGQFLAQQETKKSAEDIEEIQDE